MKHKRRLTIVCILGAALLLFFLYSRNRSMDTRNEAAEKIIQAGLDMGLEGATKVTDVPVVFTDDAGDTIVCHCLTTEYFRTPKISGLNLQAIQGIIAPEEAQTVRNCMVSGQEALLCTKGDRAYLCWTLSPEFSFVIEYTPTVVTEEEIFSMAESLKLP